MTAILVYVTAPSEVEAQKISEAVVTDRLAACANIIPSITSFYHWKGKLEQGSETAIIFKTCAELFPAIEARVKALHSNEVPCIISLPITQVSDAYLRWIIDETTP